MRDHLDQLGDTSVAVIAFASVEALTAYGQHLALPFPVLSDPGRAMYRAFGLVRGSFRAVYGVGTLHLYSRLLLRGRKLHRPNADTRQLGGDFVIGRTGNLLYACRPPSPDTRPPLGDLVNAVRLDPPATTNPV